MAKHEGLLLKIDSKGNISGYMQENDNKNREQVKELAKALENNSLVVTKLMERIDK